MHIWVLNYCVECVNGLAMRAFQCLRATRAAFSIAWRCTIACVTPSTRWLNSNKGNQNFHRPVISGIVGCPLDAHPLDSLLIRLFDRVQMPGIRRLRQNRFKCSPTTCKLLGTIFCAVFGSVPASSGMWANGFSTEPCSTWPSKRPRGKPHHSMSRARVRSLANKSWASVASSIGREHGVDDHATDRDVEPNRESESGQTPVRWKATTEREKK